MKLDENQSYKLNKRNVSYQKEKILAKYGFFEKVTFKNSKMMN